MKFTGVLLACLATIALASLKTNNIMIKDFVSSNKIPTSIILYRCDTEDINLNLVKLLNMKTSLQVTRDANHIHEQNLINHAKNILVIVDLRCSNVRKFLQQCSLLNLFYAPYRWLLLHDEEHEIPQVVGDLYFPVNSEVAIVNQPSNDFEMKFIYKISASHGWMTELYGHWNSSHGLQAQPLQVKAVRRRDLNSLEIRIGWVMEDVNTVYKYLTREEPHVDGITKVCMETTNFLFQFLNASQEIVISKSWGNLKNNTWDGLTGYLARGEVDIGGTPMFIVPERFSFVQYTLSPAHLRSAFVFKQPPLSYTSNIFLLSFQKSLWFGIGVLLCVMFVLICITTVWEWRKDGVNTSNENDSLQPKVSDVGMLVVGATCQQGSTVELKGISGRIVFILLFLVLTFLYTSFCANIVALLQSSSVQINSLQDLLDSKLKFGVEKAVWVRRYFTMETEPVRKALYEKKIAPRGIIQNFVTLEEGVKELKKGQYVFHMALGTGYRIIGQYLEEHEKCNLAEIPYLRVVDPYVAVRKGSPYIEMYKIGYERMQEFGLQNKLNRIFFTKKPKCTGRYASFMSVSLVDCSPAFLVLVYGLLIAILLGMFENIYFKVKNNLRIN